MSVRPIQKLLRELGDADIASQSQRFFKTGKGEYGEGDRFLGIRVPVLRRLVREYRSVSYKELLGLFHSPYHEERLFALLLLVDRFERSDVSERLKIYQFYLTHMEYINNWDLVDSSASQIVGIYLIDKDRQPLYELAGSSSLWERRISIIATFSFIRNHDFHDALNIAEILLNDKQDLIHKAVGWMLREVGNRDPEVEKAFLKTRYQDMPRTMLRYAIERFPESERKRYLQSRI
jgi:3-methyladenine DNA glycosylase AlkD